MICNRLKESALEINQEVHCQIYLSVYKRQGVCRPSNVSNITNILKTVVIKYIWLKTYFCRDFYKAYAIFGVNFVLLKSCWFKILDWILNIVVWTMFSKHCKLPLCNYTVLWGHSTADMHGWRGPWWRPLFIGLPAKLCTQQTTHHTSLNTSRRSV